MDKNRHLISRYLSGELDPKLAGRFEEELLSNKELREEYELHIKVDKAIADTEVLNLRMQLEDMHDAMTRKITRGQAYTRKTVIRYAAAAASVALIVGASLLNVWNFDVMERFYAPYNISMVSRSGEFSVDMTLQEAMIRYDNQEYREAVILFERVISAEPEILSNYLYSGISYMEIKEYSRAENSLQTIIDHQDNLYVEQAEWYIGFCYLLTNRKEKAMDHFRKLADEKGYFSEKAKVILKKLDK